MTDSMKFGPEWLRNMSADNTASNSISTSGQVTSSSALGGADVVSVNNSNNNSSNIGTSNFHNNNVNIANSGASRNTFPEFRYGREEMLLLFDRNCGIPEILPSYKNLFVERVQFPLALVPSTDEEMMQGSAPSAQRPGWLQRSPVGFSSTTRGSGRVGCMERGRIRGKSIYHPIFQRPNTLFDEEQRSSTIKTDRSWSERNGGDPVVSGPSTVVSGGGIGADAWNGTTPASSPRREFSNHPRNMENWRRSRNEEGSGVESTATAAFSVDGGWRMSASGFQNSHSRWGRSTSWRDDDLTSNEHSNMGSGAVGAAYAGAATIQRSNSTISTTHSERINQSGVSGKQTAVSGVVRPISVASSGIKSSVSGSMWPNNASVGPISNMQSNGNAIDEMSLPEWAMENPSDVGGTFDASGAFHGSAAGDEQAEKEHENAVPEQLSNKEKILPETEIQGNHSKSSDKNAVKSSLLISSSIKEANYQDLSSPSSTPPSVVKESQERAAHSEKSDNCNSTYVSATSTDTFVSETVSQTNSGAHSENEYAKGSATTNITNQNSSMRIGTSESSKISTNTGDFAERMMKVTDDMIEKLIMDDEDAKDDHVKTSIMTTDNKLNAQSIYMAMQQTQNSNHPSAVSPAFGSGARPSGPPNISLYNMGGGMLADHAHNIAAFHQLQQQQMAAVSAVTIGLQPTPTSSHPMNSSPPTDLWLYRDPQTKVQGPFSALEMTEWYRAGYFNENLYVRRVCDARFRPLGELIKICNGQIPFSHSNLIPIDLNSSPLTPPLPPVISAQHSAQASDFLMKTLNEHQQHQQHEKLKDITQVLSMHFQTLQDRFIHNQEIEIANELSKNECFRRLTVAEQDAVIRQKLEALGMPEYLTNLTGLSNSLAALNPTAGTQLYDTIAECTRKEKFFSNSQGQPQIQTQAQQQQQQQQQQQRNHHSSSPSAPYMSSEDFITKIKNSNHDISSNSLLGEFNLRMFLNNSSDSGAGNVQSVVTSNSHSHDFLTDQQLFGPTGSHTPNPSKNATQGPMMQMWMNSLAVNQSNSLPTQQHSMLSNNSQSSAVNNQWLNGPLVGIPSMHLSRDNCSSIGNITGSSNPAPASMWDVASLEQHVQVQQQQQQQQQQLHGQQLQQQMLQQSFEKQHHLNSAGKDFLNCDDESQAITHKHEENRQELQQQQKEESDPHKSPDTAVKVSSINDTDNKQENKIKNQEQECESHQQQSVNEKQHSHVNNKRNSTSSSITPKSLSKGKNENCMETVPKKIEEERRREQNEEKRRQKEERKRHQMEEEKRRLIQAEEEKHRQMLEEEKRQQQIQAQRRKALLSSTNNSATNNNCNNIASILASSSVGTGGNPKSKEQQRIQSSVAPWSIQTIATTAQGPGLAEIQKAERRERRADQQRQLEIQEKSLRALAAAAETQDNTLKWNAAPIPVKSIAEIQAEEAKRLAHEQMESQKRKEQETHNNLAALSSTINVAGGINHTTNVASIWSGNKIWGTGANASFFWEEPNKFNNKSLNVSTSNSTNMSLSSNTTVASIVSQSSTPSLSSKNIKKSQSVAVMQNTVSLPNSNISSGSSNQKKTLNCSTLTTNAKQSKQKPDINFSAVGGIISENKKNTVKNNSVANRNDDYEAEFNNWCTKSLNNMNAEVDVPTFVSFLRDLESPYEVKDYIRMYLGESKEYMDFAKQFLERRSKYKNLQRAQNAHDDDLCKPAQAITPSVNENSENKSKQKKIKKNKMTKLDARILGFSVTAAEGRINVGDRDYGDAP